jgi:hypothetical protein
MLTSFFLLIGAALVAYAIYTNYGKTDPTKSVAGRVVAALMAGAMTIGAAVASWFHSPPATP